MDHENNFIYWCIEQYCLSTYIINPFPFDTDFYNHSYCPAEKDLILKSLDYVSNNTDNNDAVYVCHMLARLTPFITYL